MSRVVPALLLASLAASPAVSQTIDLEGKRRNPPAPAVEPQPGDRSLKALPPPQKPFPVEKVKPLVTALDSPDFRTREKAHRDLLATDERALPHLEAALDAAESPEVQRRLEVVIEKLKRDRAVKPTVVSVHAKGLSAKTVLKDICRQAGYTFRGDLGDAAKVTLDLDDVPFWEAVAKVCEPHGLTFEPEDGGSAVGGLSVYAGESLNPYTAVSGPFRFVATNIACNQSLQLGGLRRGGSDAFSEYLYLSAQVVAEPKLPIVTVGPARLLSATDDKGVSVAEPTDVGAKSDPLTHSGGYRTYTQNLSVSLVRGHKDATRIKELRGVLPALLLTDVRAELEVENISAAKGKKFASRSCDVEVQEVKQDGELTTVRVVLTPREVREDNDGWWNGLPQRMVLTDDKGVRFVNNGAREVNETPAAVCLDLQFTPPPERKKLKPATLTLTYWVCVQKDLEFTFKDIPLP